MFIRTWHVVLARHAGQGHVIWTSVASSKFLYTVWYLLLYVRHDCWLYVSIQFGAFLDEISSFETWTSVVAWKADSSLDLDEDETSVLLDESVVRSEDGGTADRSSEGGDQEADISESDSEMDPGNESTGQMRLSPDGPSNSGTGSVPSSSTEVRPRRIVRPRRQPGWMRSGEWDVG